jgi:hypothetical protein
VLKNVKDRILNQFDEHQHHRRSQNGMEMVEEAVAFYLHLAGKMGDQFLILHRHYPYQMAETSVVCRNHLESIYNCLLDIFEEGIKKGGKDGSVSVDSPRNTAMVLFSMVDGVVRLNTYRVYDAGALYESLFIACRRLLATNQ